MAKETEERLLRALEFLKEPHGSTISTIVKAMNGDGPQVSLKKIVQTLRGCVENGLLKVSEGRVKLKQLNVLSGPGKDEAPAAEERPRNGCTKPLCHSPGSGHGRGGREAGRKGWRQRGPRGVIPVTGCEGNGPEAGGEGGEGEGGEGGEGGNGSNCPQCPVCKKKKKPKCAKPKPKCPKPKPKCPKPKPKCPKPKPKCPKPKPKCKKPRRKPKKKCAMKKIKIQPYCKKKKST